MRLAGSAHYAYAPNRPLIESLSAEGEISSRSLLVQASAARSEVRDANSRFQLRDGNLSLSEIRLHVLGGEVRGNASIQDLAGRQRGQISASLRGISLESLQAMIKSAALDQVRFGGVIDADTKASWVGSHTKSRRRCGRNHTLIGRFTQHNTGRSVISLSRSMA